MNPSSESPAAPTGRTPLLLIALASVAAFSPGFLSHFFYDDIRWMREAAKVGDLRSLLIMLFSRHNEHLAPWTALCAVVSHRLFGISHVPLFLIGLSQWLLIVGGIWRLGRHWFRSHAARLVFTALTAVNVSVIEVVIWFSAFGFSAALLMTIISLLAIESWFEAPGGRPSALWGIALGCLLAPVASLVGLPTAFLAVVYAGVKAGAATNRGGWVRRALPPVGAAVGGFAAFGLLYLFSVRLSLHLTGRAPVGQPPVDSAHLVNAAQALRMISSAFFLRLWRDLLPFGLGWLLLGFSVVTLGWFATAAQRMQALAFLAVILLFLGLALLPRLAWGPRIIDWGRYYTYPLVAASGIVALAADALLSRHGERLGGWRRGAFVIAGLVTAATALHTAEEAWRVHAQPRRRYVGEFCEQWRAAPEAYARATGRSELVFPDVTIEILELTPPFPLSDYAFCWPRRRDWSVRWVAPGEGFPPDFIAFMSNHPEYGTANHFLRRYLYGETD